MLLRCRSWLIASVLLLTGCASTPPLDRQPFNAGYCHPPAPIRSTVSSRLPPGKLPELSPELLAMYSRRTLLTAHAAGILPALQQMATTANRAAGDGTSQDLAHQIALLRQQQYVITRLLVLSSTIASIAAELDCEGERADQLGAYLAQYDSARTQRFNVLSIVVGALSGIGATASVSRHTQYAFGVGGGALAAGLGIFSLDHDGATYEYEHDRNLLTDIWNETETSALWPASLWYMLTEPAFSNEGKTSIAHNTRQRWQQYRQLARLESKGGRKLEALLFGRGGEYSADAFALRANMLNQLQSSVRLLNQELQGVMFEIGQEHQ